MLFSVNTAFMLSHWVLSTLLHKSQERGCYSSAMLLQNRKDSFICKSKNFPNFSFWETKALSDENLVKISSYFNVFQVQVYLHSIHNILCSRVTHQNPNILQQKSINWCSPKSKVLALWVDKHLLKFKQMSSNIEKVWTNQLLCFWDQ